MKDCKHWWVYLKLDNRPYQSYPKGIFYCTHCLAFLFLDEDTQEFYIEHNEEVKK